MEIEQKQPKRLSPDSIALLDNLRKELELREYSTALYRGIQSGLLRILNDPETAYTEMRNQQPDFNPNVEAVLQYIISTPNYYVKSDEKEIFQQKIPQSAKRYAISQGWAKEDNSNQSSTFSYLCALLDGFEIYQDKISLKNTIRKSLGKPYFLNYRVIYRLRSRTEAKQFLLWYILTQKGFHEVASCKDPAVTFEQAIHAIAEGLNAQDYAETLTHEKSDHTDAFNAFLAKFNTEFPLLAEDLRRLSIRIKYRSRVIEALGINKYPTLKKPNPLTIQYHLVLEELYTLYLYAKELASKLTTESEKTHFEQIIKTITDLLPTVRDEATKLDTSMQYPGIRPEHVGLHIEVIRKRLQDNQLLLEDQDATQAYNEIDPSGDKELSAAIEVPTTETNN